LQGTPKDFDSIFYGIIDANQEYWSDYSGYVGLAPFSASLPIQEQQLNMMNNMVLNNQIDHNVVSIWAYESDRQKSFLKFGSYDPGAGM